ncbi:ZNF318 [Bugula neritina]|uniref:ZNF318 n=1 Tax=Bugula neritina TaxID=10212 RepID=A0A7J7KGP3_BUGNE|nr:ZNF318 [Bugula neritina]
MLPQRSRSPSESSGVLRGSSERERLNSYHDKRLDSSSLTRDAFRESEDFKNFKLVVRTDSSTTRTKRVMDDDLLDTKAQLDSRLKGEGQDMPSERRVIRRVGALGSSTLEKHSMETDKEKYLRELEQAEILKAFGSEPLLTRLTKQEIFNIQQMIEFNKNKLLKSEKQLLMLQDNQSDVMKNLKSASVGEQYHLDKTLGQNIRLQNEITTEIKDLKKLIRDDEMRLEEQTDQERKLREITKKKLAAAKAMEKSGGLVVKEESPPPEKQDRKYRRAIEDKLMGRKSKEQLAEEAANKEAVGKGLISQPGTSVVEYYDPGTHWCKSCNFVAFKLYGYLEHLQTSSHMKRREKIGKPWQPEEVKNPPRKSLISRQETVVQPMKGIEFVHPVDAYYCLLCNFFGGDRATLEHHLKSAEHHKQYENHLTENPMYERRYKVDKEAGLQEAKKLEQKRQEEQERLRAAEREEEERRRDAIKRKEREKQEEEEKRKREKLLKIQAKKKAEVLAITRGGDAGDSDDVVELADEPDEQPKNETPQERIKRELLEKMRAKKAQTAEDQKRFNTESAIAKANRLAQEAKKAQEKVKAKAAEIEKSVYGPKQEEGTLPPPGVFLSQPVVSAAQKAATTESSQASTTQANSVSQAATSVNTTSTISPFVQKMMEMEEKGEIITTASVQKAAAAKRQANTGVMGPPGPPGVSGGHPGVSGGPPGVAGGPPGVPMSPQIRPMGPAAGPINSSMMQARPVRPQMGPQGYWPPRPMMRPVPMMEQQQAVPMQGAANRMMMRPQPMIGSGHMAPPMMHSGPMRHPHMMQQNYSQAGPVVQAQPQYHRAEMEPDLAPPGTTPTLVSSQSKPVARSQEEDSDDSDDSSSSDDTDDTDNTGEHSFSVSSILSQFAADPQAKLSSAFTNTSSDTVSTSSLSYANSSQASAVTATISTPTLTGASTTAATSNDGKLKGTETDLETDNMENMTFTVIDSVGDEAIS